MGIKWQDVHVMVSPLSNKLYLCKRKPLPGTTNCYEATYKSGDMTDEIIKAVMEHMLRKCRDDEVEATLYTIAGVCELQLKDLKRINERLAKEDSDG